MRPLSSLFGPARVALGASALFILASAPASAHTHLLDPPPRTDAANLKAAPCGGVASTGILTELEAGQTLVVTWEETIHHPGWYRLALSEGGDVGFEDHILADDIPDVPGSASYEATVTLPDLECEDCTLQLIQVMTDKPLVNGDYQKYYSCADLRLVPVGEASPAEDTPTLPPDGGGCPTPPESDGRAPWLGLVVLGWMGVRSGGRRRSGRASSSRTLRGGIGLVSRTSSRLR